MPPIPLKFSSRVSHHNPPIGYTGGKKPMYYSIAEPKPHTSSEDAPAQLDPPSPPPMSTIPAAPLPGASSGSSSSSSGPSASARRKGVAHRSPAANDNSGRFVTLTPLVSAIIERCVLASNPATTVTISPRKATSSKSQSAPPQSHIHPYSRRTDLGNDRSPNPSPRELLRAQRTSHEKAQVKKDSIAVARAAIAAKRKNKRPGPKAYKKDAAGRSPSPSNEVRGLLGLGGSGLSREVLPTIVHQPASAESSPLITPAARSLKRTRSAGISAVGTTLANALGTGNLGVGSPLKAVTGPNDDAADIEDGADRRVKRSRTHEPPVDKAGPSKAGGRKKSTSPNNNKNKPLPDAKPHPLATSRLAPGVAPTRQSNRASSVALATASAGLEPSSTGATSMRRVVSAAGEPAGNRRDSTGSQGSEGGVTMRSRREVNLPRALRDYETRTSTMV